MKDSTSDFELSELLITDQSKTGNKFIDKITLSPNEQKRVKLGAYTHANPPSGFTLEFDPDPSPPGSVITQITDTGTGGEYELILHIANYSMRPVTTTIRQI